MLSLRILNIAQDWITRVVQEGDVVIDATAGNGHDTLFLSRLVGDTGHVYAFDIQEDAIKNTRELLQKKSVKEQVDYLSRVSLHAQCHSLLSDHCQGTVAAVMFNLGYLPSGDKSIIKKFDTTITALEATLSLLKVGGVISIACYPGHEGGGDEASKVDQWSKELPTIHYQVVRLQPYNAKSIAPYLLVLQKVR